MDVTDASVGPSGANPFTQRSGTLSLVVVQPVPTVTSVSPAFDNVAGGKSITITGTEFTGATQVTFGTNDVLAADFRSHTATQIVVNAPPAASVGTVNVTVTTPGGTSADAGTADDFDYGTAPVLIDDVLSTSTPTYPTPSPLLAADTASLGALFSGSVDGYYVGTGTDTTLTVADVTASLDAAGLTFAWPEGYRGGPANFGIRAYNRFGISQPKRWAFSVQDPVLTSTLIGAEAQQGVALSGFAIQTTGGRAPYICEPTPASGSLPAGVTLAADCTLSGTPTENGTFDFTVDVTDASVGPSGANPFTQRSGTLSLVVVQPVPTVTSVSPAFDNVAGGKSITITGTEFTGATQVTFGMLISILN